MVSQWRTRRKEVGAAGAGQENKSRGHYRGHASLLKMHIVVPDELRLQAAQSVSSMFDDDDDCYIFQTVAPYSPLTARSRDFSVNTGSRVRKNWPTVFPLIKGITTCLSLSIHQAVHTLSTRCKSRRLCCSFLDKNRLYIFFLRSVSWARLRVCRVIPHWSFDGNSFDCPVNKRIVLLMIVVDRKSHIATSIIYI